MSLPRLTCALRAKLDYPVPDDEEEDLSVKRQRNTQRRANASLSWKQLVNIIRSDGRRQKDAYSSELRHLQHAAQAIVGGTELDSETVDSATVFLFKEFHNAKEGPVSNADVARLQPYFGSVTKLNVKELCSAISRLRSVVSDNVWQQLMASFNQSPNVLRNEFGKNIKINCDFAPESLEDDLDWLEPDTADTCSNAEFSMHYVETSCDVLPNRTPQQTTQNSYVPKLSGRPSLYLEMESYFGSGGFSVDMPLEVLASTVFEILCSPRPDDQLQTELFDLLGFDRFDLIQSLLQKRQKIVQSAILCDPDNGVEMAPSLSVRNEQSRPNYGCQITVQTEEEKMLRKVVRREEKKQGKRRDGDQDDFSKPNFNPQELRSQREAALYAAAHAPLFSSRSSSSHVEQYPFVFDSYSAAKQSSGFIAGAKMVLPIGFERLSQKLYEEINIPACDRPPENFVYSPVMINTLDDICQTAFSGTKKLNLIQSVVFDAAYKSNENLLICAPTGAGKTNIAMLTILHEIKQHISQGVIQVDEFKIVYVAPMKALAAEMVRNFGQRLSRLGITVAELTGDMQLSKTEIMKTQMLVTTPEKWDVVTRKSTGDVALTQIVRLLIIDEVHLLHDDRGAVIESLVARTLRQVESSQTMIRIVGLSATLPNYLDVARFLHVNFRKGLFFFDGRFRPVPLAQSFLGIKATNRMQQMQDFNVVTYEKVIQQVRNGHQVMVFVHARNETVRTANVLAEMVRNNGQMSLFTAEKSAKLGEALKQISHSRNKQLRELFPEGFAIHHAGMLRQDRNLVERYFGEGLVRVIVCTATLAWGVNLPAHAVVIKGTQIYDAKKGSFVDLGVLDVMQIFGRAGRPQFDTFGHGTIITTHDKLSHYLSLLTQQNPIESQFINSLTDNLNAEISLGTVTNVEEGVRWLSYTYLYVRMRCNPLVYGVSHTEVQDDPMLEIRRKDLIVSAARSLDKAHMIRFTEKTGLMFATDLGRTASHFYIKYDTIEIFNEYFKDVMSEDRVFAMVSKAQEFDQIKVRDEELEELDRHRLDSCHVDVAGGSENTFGKVNILLQTYISRGNIDNFSLVSDQAYVAQNSARIIRGLFEMALRNNWSLMAGRLLKLSKIVEKRLWDWENPLRQFTYLSPEILTKIEERGLSIEKLKDMDAKEIGLMIRHVNMGSRIKECVNQIPMLDIEPSIQPITRSVLRVGLKIRASFRWNDRVHGKTGEPFWIWIEDPDTNHMYHSEYFLMHKKHVQQDQIQSLVFTVPIFEPLPSQYYVHVISDRWLGSDMVFPVSFQHLILPEKHPPHTELLDLQPLPLSALRDERLESLYNFTHFNPVQTQIFHPLYHTDCNVLLGAPTGSGKTVAAELAIFRVFREYPNTKAVYIAPLKALVRERMEDWKIRIEQKLGKKLVELTGDVTPDMHAVARADLIVTTPEKWDGISRSWQTRKYVKAVSLLVIDEIHLLGNDRGPVLEVIVSRTNFISSHTEHSVRVVGLSTALANARDLADWLGIKQIGLFNFRPSVRPVPLEVHIQGFPGKHYCPRMATMNKPAFHAIKLHSPAKPVLIFVSSRRQTRLTALDLIAFLAADDDPKQWLHTSESEIEAVIADIKESNLRLTLAFGIGLHHAGLHERDRKTVEQLFVSQKIQVLIATSTLAWGVNFPAHLVIVKGTEYYDGKTKHYIDFPITDVLQMMGRAGRPQFDNQGVAVILVHDVKKHFYKKFLYEPFPVESSLLEVLPDHLNAEIVAGTISTKQDAVDYITWTYFFRRLVVNPSFYKLDNIGTDEINRFLSELVQRAVSDLCQSYCVEVADDDLSIRSTTLGHIASYYYLSHSSVRMFREKLTASSTVKDLVVVLANAHEFSDLPVRHNEDQVNSELATKLPMSVDPHTYDNSNTKTNLLLQAHFSRVTLPSADYHTDTKSVMDQVPRILQAMLDVCADAGWLATTLQVIIVMQMVMQARWHYDSTLLMLPHLQPYHLSRLRRRSGDDGGKPASVIDSLPELMDYVDGHCQRLEAMLASDLSKTQLDQILQVIAQLPQLELSLKMRGTFLESLNERPVDVNYRGGVRRDWVQVYADSEYALNVTLTKLNWTRKFDNHAYCPHFAKPKDEGWILVLGEVETRDIVAVRRVASGRGKRTSTTVAFFSPERLGRVIYTLYVMSDCYIGLDQQYDVCLEVVCVAPPATDQNQDV